MDLLPFLKRPVVYFTVDEFPKVLLCPFCISYKAETSVSPVGHAGSALGFSDFSRSIAAGARETWDVVAHQKRGINISAVFNMLCCHYLPVNLTRGALKVAVNCRNAAQCERGAWQGTPSGSSAGLPPVIKMARWNIEKADGAMAKNCAGCAESAERRTLFLPLFHYLFATFSPSNCWTATHPTPFKQRRFGTRVAETEGERGPGKIYEVYWLIALAIAYLHLSAWCLSEGALK